MGACVRASNRVIVKKTYGRVIKCVWSMPVVTQNALLKYMVREFRLMQVYVYSHAASRWALTKYKSIKLTIPSLEDALYVV